MAGNAAGQFHEGGVKKVEVGVATQGVRVQADAVVDEADREPLVEADGRLREGAPIGEEDLEVDFGRFFFVVLLVVCGESGG